MFIHTYFINLHNSFHTRRNNNFANIRCCAYVVNTIILLIKNLLMHTALKSFTITGVSIHKKNTSYWSFGSHCNKNNHPFTETLSSNYFFQTSHSIVNKPILIETMYILLSNGYDIINEESCRFLWQVHIVAL